MTIIKSAAIICCVTALLIYPAVTLAEEFEDALPVSPDYEDWQFQEDAVNLPDYPDFANLLKVRIDAVDATQGRLQYFVDPKSLNIGRDDVVLVTMVIKSRRGAKNVLFEGYRCDSREYKTFAYGTSNNTFYEPADPKWKPAPGGKGTAQDYRRELLTVYFCDADRQPLARDDILRIVKYPHFRDDEGRDF